MTARPSFHYPSSQGDTEITLLSGRAFDLLAPDPNAIDFREICYALGQTNRFVGHAPVAVSVALHTLICACALDHLGRHDRKTAHAALPYVLLHDAHEALIGDISSPMKRALAACVGDDFVGAIAAEIDRAIWAAAGLPEPTEAIVDAVRVCDAVALSTEWRDFRGMRPHDGWPAPLPRTAKYHNGIQAADDLLAMMRKALPRFRGGRS